MKCPHCNITIACRTPVCPLCHVPFGNADGSLSTAKKLPRAFPIRGKTPLFATPMFDKIYFVAAVNILIVSFIAETILSDKYNWIWVIASILFYLYFLIRGTLQDTKYFSQKVVAQAIVLSVVAITLQGIIPRPFAVYEFILPSIYMISMLMIGIYILIHFRTPRKHLINLLSIALLGFLPFIVVLIGETPDYLMAVITAALGAAIILTAIIFSARKIILEIKRIFHI